MKKTSAFLLTALLLSGCNLGPDYVRDPMQLPADWQTDADAHIWPSADWWQQFQSPRLNSLIQQAQTSNYDILAAIARVRQADAAATIAGAPLWPSIGINGDASHTHTNGGGNNNVLLNSGGRDRNTDAYSANLAASYELDFWGKNAAALEAAEQRARASQFDKQTVALTITADVANTYFNILQLQDRLAIAKDNLKATQDLLNAVQLRFNVGIVTALDVAQQENLVATQKTIIPQLELLLTQNKNALAILLGQLPEEFDTSADTAGLLDGIHLPVVVAGLPSELLQRRPDVQNAEALLIAANANIKNARAQFFPSIALTAQGGYQSAEFASFIGNNNFLYSLGASLTQPIFQGGLLRGNLELSKAQYEELLQNYRKTILTSFSDVENALAAVQRNGQQLQAQIEATDTAKTAYQLSQRQFQGGITDITTVLNTQRALFSAQDNLVVTKAAYLQAIVSLYTALGGGWSVGNNVMPVLQPVTQKPVEEPMVIE